MVIVSVAAPSREARRRPRGAAARAVRTRARAAPHLHGLSWPAPQAAIAASPPAPPRSSSARTAACPAPAPFTELQHGKHGSRSVTEARLARHPAFRLRPRQPGRGEGRPGGPGSQRRAQGRTTSSASSPRSRSSRGGSSREGEGSSRASTASSRSSSACPTSGGSVRCRRRRSPRCLAPRRSISRTATVFARVARGLGRFLRGRAGVEPRVGKDALASRRVVEGEDVGTSRLRKKPGRRAVGRRRTAARLARPTELRCGATRTFASAIRRPLLRCSALAAYAGCEAWTRSR